MDDRVWRSRSAGDSGRRDGGCGRWWRSQGADRARLGAPIAVDYLRPAWVDEVRAAVGALDVVFDGVGASIGRSAFDLLDRCGHMLSFGLAGGDWADISDEAATARGATVLRGLQVTPEESREFSRNALAEAAAGRLRPLIGQRFKLEEAAAAHAAIEARTTIGKTLLVTG